MKTRLKLYDSLLKVYLSKKEKNRLRKIAFSNKMTLSEYTRNLIRFAIVMEDYKKNFINQEINSDRLDKILGGLNNY